MVQKTMIIVAAKHKEWVEIVLSFGCKQETAEDIVQEMYYKIQLKLEKGLDIMYNEKEINYYYIFKTLRTLFYDLKRKGKNITMVSMDDIHLTTSDVNYQLRKQQIDSILDDMYWYDKKVFEICASGKSVAALSRDTGISYYSLYNTYTNAKKYIKEKL